MGKPRKKLTRTKPVLHKTGPAHIATTTTSIHKNFFLDHWLPLLILFIFATGLYIQSAGFDYTLDDTAMITDNKFTQKGISGIGEIFSQESFSGYFGKQENILEGARYRPLSIATFAIEKSLGSTPSVSHLINVLLYALTGLLLFRVLLYMFPYPDKRKWFASVPFIASMLFIAHPLHVEVVANIKSRDELLALLGEAGSLYFTFAYLQSKKNKYLIFSFLALLAGILSKENAVTFLVVIPLTVYFFTASTLIDKIKVTLPAVAAVIIYLVMRVQAVGYLFSGNEITDIMNNPFYGMHFSERTATVFYTLLLYLKLHVFPYPLTHDYDPYQIPIMYWSQWEPWLSLLLYSGLILIIIKGWRKKWMASYVAAYYLVTISIVSNLFFSIGSFMNERFVYPVSFSFCMAAGWLIAKGWAQTRILQIISFSFFIALLAFFTTRTMERIPDWRNNAALLQSGIKYSPRSAKSNCFYAMEIWNRYLKLPDTTGSARRYAMLDTMKFYFDKSAAIVPSYHIPQTMRVYVAVEYHKLNKNIDPLIRDFESVNRSGIVVEYVLDYLSQVNQKVTGKEEAEKLSAFYSRMIGFFSQFPATEGLIARYKALQEEVQLKISS
jgi:hypothetical protein